MLKRLSLGNTVFWALIFWSTSMVFVEFPNPKDVILFGLVFLLILGWLIVIPVAHFTLKKQWEMGNAEITAIQTSFLTPEDVDSQLHLLAKRFNFACRDEVHFQGSDDMTDVTERWIDMKKSELDRCKKEFWEAHALARRLGYDTLPKVGDYLKLPIVHED